MNQKFNLPKLARAILKKRTDENLTFRTIQQQTKGKLIGATLCRIEAQTQVPNAETLAYICNWLDRSVAEFYDTSKL